MKMTQDHYERLHISIKDLLESSPNAIYVMQGRGYSPMRIRWECYHASKIDKHEYFTYKDNHIDTALIHIMRTFGSD
jgi:hypothetical protein